MNDWFEWNDVRCTEYGIHVLEQPVLTLPNERATFVDVPGRRLETAWIWMRPLSGS